MRDAVRSDCSEDDVIALISAAVNRKKRQHAGQSKTLIHTPFVFVHLCCARFLFLLSDTSNSCSHPPEAIHFSVLCFHSICFKCVDRRAEKGQHQQQIIDLQMRRNNLKFYCRNAEFITDGKSADDFDRRIVLI